MGWEAVYLHTEGASKSSYDTSKRAEETSTLIRSSKPQKTPAALAPRLEATSLS
jgi:hypothetical protein